jgi:Skp family chaperone for outer membrane proteins
MVLSPRLSLVFVLAVLVGRWAPLARLHAEEEPDPTSGFVKALQDDNALVRKRAALALERLGPKARAATAALEKALMDDDADVRAAAAAALERMDAPRSLAALLRRVADREALGRFRAEACKELGEQFGHDPAAVRALEAALTDPVIKLDAARALEMIDTRAKRKTAPVARRGTRIALVNLKHVVMNYQKWLQFTEELKVEYKKYEDKVPALNRQMAQLRKDSAATMEPDEKASIEKQAKKLQQQMQEVANEAKEVIGKKESAELVIIYREITEAATAYARENDIDLVMHYNDATSEAEMNSPQNIQRKVVAGPTTPLYVKAADIDISQQVVERLNERHARANSNAGK